MPNILYTILDSLLNKTIKEIKHYYNNEHDEIIERYFSFLVANEYGFVTDEPDHFPKLNLEFYSPEEISNCIIDIDEDSQHDYRLISNQLEELNCKAVQLRIYDLKQPNEIIDMVESFNNTRVFYINLVMPYQSRLPYDLIIEILKTNRRLQKILIYNSPSEGSIEDCKSNAQVKYIQRPIDPELDCGNINHSLFIADITMLSESKKFNSCLNKKVSIDREGNIRNCPSLKSSYGNIKTTSLVEATRSSLFREIWNINKDQILVCQDCEFRYICMDCRAFIQDSNNLKSKPRKCNYDPYKAIFL